MNPPDADELEITVFGPGYGEAILLHLGAQRWVTVDSCIDTATGLCTPLEYLREINQDPSACVQGIIVTHWHDDHVRGLSRLIEAAPNAKFYCSSALIEREFTTFAAAFNKDSTLKLTGGLSEIYKTLQHLAHSDRDIGMCGKDSRILNIAASVFPHGLPIEISSLSPSHRQHQLFLQSIANVQSLVGQTKFRAQANRPNHVSVVIHVIVGQSAFLLGADLEEAGDPNLGWQSIVNSPGRSQIKAFFFKIPHHGSENGHYEQVWSDMLVPNPIAIVTPYSRLKNPLPTAYDRKRIRQYTSEAFITSNTPLSRFRSNDHAVDRTLREMGAAVRSIAVSPGRVTVRVKPGQAPRILRSDQSSPI